MAPSRLQDAVHFGDDCGGRALVIVLQGGNVDHAVETAVLPRQGFQLADDEVARQGLAGKSVLCPADGGRRPVDTGVAKSLASQIPARPGTGPAADFEKRHGVPPGCAVVVSRDEPYQLLGWIESPGSPIPEDRLPDVIRAHADTPSRNFSGVVIHFAIRPGVTDSFRKTDTVRSAAWPSP